MSLFSHWSVMSLAPQDGSMIEIRDHNFEMIGFARFVSGQWQCLDGRTIKPTNAAVWMSIPKNIAASFEAQTPMLKT